MGQETINYAGKNFYNKIYKIFKIKRWKIHSYKTESGSRYVFGKQGFKACLVRLADHEQPYAIRRKLKSNQIPDFDFNPYSPHTIEQFINFLDGYS